MYARRFNTLVRVTVALLAFCGSTLAHGFGDKELPAGLPDRAPNFRLADLEGNVHELYSLGDAKSIVLFVQIIGCPIVRQSYPYFEELRAKYEPFGVRFLYVNSNPYDTVEGIRAECKEYSATAPVLRDPHRALAHALGFRRSAETMVIEPRTWRIMYRGMADDRFDYGLQRMTPGNFWLRDVLDAMTHDKVPTIAPTIAKGCLIDLDFTVKPDFAKDVAPVLVAKFGTQFGLNPDEMTARMNSRLVVDALLTGRTSGHEVKITDAEAEALVAWLFTPSEAETPSR
jgi:peroxiredoxin